MFLVKYALCAGMITCGVFSHGLVSLFCLFGILIVVCDSVSNGVGFDLFVVRLWMVLFQIKLLFYWFDNNWSNN